jgi:flagellar secretion chaperone FliS
MAFPGNGAAAYRQMATRGGIEDASPHRLIAMLLDGALARLSHAKGLIERGEIAEKGRVLSQTIDIVGELNGSLDHARGPEIAGRLASLYDYMSRRLLQANSGNDIAAIDEVAALFREISNGWNAVDPDSSSIRALAAVR